MSRRTALGPGRRPAAARCGMPGAGAPRPAVPARVLRRHAAARDDRHGPDGHAGADHRRRADDRARRDRAAAGARAAGSRSATADDVALAADQPRHHRGRARSATGCWSCTPAGSSRTCRPPSCATAGAAPVHPGAARRRAGHGRPTSTCRWPVIPGRPVDPAHVPAGCAFAARCPLADARCRERATRSSSPTRPAAGSPAGTPASRSSCGDARAAPRAHGRSNATMRRSSHE